MVNTSIADMFIHGYLILTTDLGFLKLCKFGSAIAHPWDMGGIGGDHLQPCGQVL